MPELHYRAATRTDLPFIIHLLTIDAIGNTVDDPAAANSPAYETALAQIDADPNSEMFVAELDGQPIGCFQLTYIPGLSRRGMWRGEVENVHISPDFRSNGYGGTMIRWAIERCRERNCGLVQLTSNKARLDAHRFYVRLGFQQSHEGFKLFL